MGKSCGHELLGTSCCGQEILVYPGTRMRLYSPAFFLPMSMEFDCLKIYFIFKRLDNDQKYFVKRVIGWGYISTIKTSKWNWTFIIIKSRSQEPSTTDETAQFGPWRLLNWEMCKTKQIFTQAICPIWIKSSLSVWGSQ